MVPAQHSEPGVASLVDMSTNIRVVSQCPEKSLNRAFSLETVSRFGSFEERIVTGGLVRKYP